MSDSQRLPTLIVTENDGRRALVVDGYVQSVAAEDLRAGDVWHALLPPRRKPWKALILGAGAGAVTHLLIQLCGPIAITAVEIDPRVAQLALDEFGLRSLPNVTVVVADAFAWIKTCDTAFDYICIDMYTGGAMAHGTFSTDFLRDIVQRLVPGGSAAINIFKTRRLPEQRHRLEQLFTITDTIYTGGNVVFHMHPYG